MLKKELPFCLVIWKIIVHLLLKLESGKRLCVLARSRLIVAQVVRSVLWRMDSGCGSGNQKAGPLVKAVRQLTPRPYPVAVSDRAGELL